MFGLARALARNGVIGINKRNADYVLLYNRRRYYPLVDDKAQTKVLAQGAGIPIPTLYGKIEFPHEAKRLGEIVASHASFVVKPAQGSGGDGILIVVGRTGNLFRLADGAHMSVEDMIYHVNTILAGTFSLGGQNDKALIEYRVTFDPLFDAVSYRGVPDIRIVSFLGVPVMAMVRLPTRMSRGKANLHQGAIGAGISIDEGRTLTAVWRNGVIETDRDASGHGSGRHGASDSPLGQPPRDGGAVIRADPPGLPGHRHRARPGERAARARAERAPRAQHTDCQPGGPRPPSGTGRGECRAPQDR